MATAAEINELKEKVAEACRVLARLDLTREPAGHVSARIPGTDHMLIKARGPRESGVRYTTPDDIVEADMEGNIIGLPEGLASPREIFIHTWMYKKRPEIGSVIHIHPPMVVTFTVVDKPLLPIYGAYDPGSLRLLLDGVPLYDKSVLVNNDELGEELADAIQDKEIIMMRGHGVTAVGPDPAGAGINVILLNEIAEMNYKARLIGEPRPISDEDIASFKSAGRRTGAAGGGSAWETYRRMVDA
ncbi:MAG: class II aldolase/adducin family protein [Chloroflexi bacterium]|nr:class II aldolase/adducin family protein [Chloroflexota bacterium]MDA1174036.1 class II aldolase/adducin family protein [Chloroflexota bacterium]